MSRKLFKASIMFSFLLLIPESKAVCETNDIYMEEIVGAPNVVSVNSIERPIFYGYSESEIDLMAAVVFFEAGNQDTLGKQLVVDAILNRVDSPWFPNTITEVIDEQGQFATAKNAHNLSGPGPIDCYGAVISELTERKNEEVIYFGRAFGSGDPMFKHGDHCFSAISKRLKEKEL